MNEKADSRNATLKSILSKDLKIVRADIKSDLSKTIYIVGLVQFLAIGGSVMGMPAFMNL